MPLEMILKETHKLNVDRAMNGQEAINKFQTSLFKECCDNRYKLILMDLNMPVVDGYEATISILSLFKQVHSSNSYPNGDGLYVVAVTAFVNEENIRRCYRVGMVDVLHKPVNCENLKNVLDKYFFQNS